MKSRKTPFGSLVWRAFLLVAGISICGLAAGCLTVSGPVGQTKTTSVDPRAEEIKKRIAELEKERDFIREARKEEQLKLLEQMEALPPGVRTEVNLVDDPVDREGRKDIYIPMHRANIEAMEESLRKIDAEIDSLRKELGELEARRPKPEAELSPPSASPSDDLSGGCFTPDTRILLPNGVKKIAAMSVGDELVAYDETTGELTARPVVQTYRFPANHYFVINGEIKVTAMHRLLTDRGWVRVKDLKLGDLLRTSEGWIPLESKEFVEANLEVFNLEVAVNHDFFVVGDKHSYLVHNCGGGK